MLLAKCLSHDMDAAVVRDRCKHSTHRVIKLLRLPWLLKRLAIHPSQLFDADVRIVHVVRHPGDILRSRDAAFWLPSNGSLDHEADKLCMHMATNAVVLANAYPSQHITMRYEDFVEDPDAALRRLAAFIGLEMTDAMWERARAVQRRRHADVPRRSFTMLGYSKAEMHAFVWRVRSCAAVMVKLGYRPSIDEL